MAASHDWVTPRLYGKPWFEKPPLYYWGAALSFRLFGVSDTAARLPSAICALLATLALGWLVWRAFGAAAARWLLLLLPTSVGMIGFSRAAATDMPFSGMLTMAMVAAAAVLRLDAPGGGEGSRSKTWLVPAAFGFFLGLAVLAKGPAGVILAGGAIFFWAVATGRWRDAFRLFHPAALAAFFATALPWYLICARRNPDFFRIFIIEHNFKRFLTPEFQHLQPFWYYAPVFLIALLPWTLVFLAVAGKLLRKISGREAISPFLVFLCTWTLFPLLFFTLSKSKLPGYILPAIPPAVALGADYLAGLLGEEEHRGRYRVLSALLAPGFGMAAAVGMALAYLHPASSLLIAILGGTLMIVLLVLVGFFTFTRRPAAMLLAGIGVTVFSLALAIRGVLPSFDRKLSSRTVAGGYAAAGAAGERVAAFRLNRAWQYGINYYLGAELPEYDPASREPAFVFVSVQGMDALRQAGIPFEMIDARCDRAVLVRTGSAEKK